ncbi:MAG: hypothetical protein Q7S83_02490 [bacterium]|nr:hypothetical protein [bacterium]
MIHYEKNDPHIIEFYKFKILWVILIFAVSFLFFSANPVSCDFGTSRPGNSAQMAQSGFVNPNGEASRSPEFDRVRAMPKSAEAPLWIPKGAEPTIVDLKSGVWSREIVMPTDSDFETIVNPGPDHFYIWFKDDTIMKVSQSDKEFKDYGLRKKVFRMLVEEPDKKLTVTVR